MNKHLTGSKFMLFLLLWFIVMQLLSSGVLMALENAYLLDINAVITSPWYIVTLQLGVLLFPLFLWLFIKRDNIKHHLPNIPLGSKNILIIVVLSFFLQPAMMTISGISSLFFNNYVSDMIYSFMEQPLWLILIATAVTPAVCEELVFRGYIQSQHQDRSIKQAAILNGLFFGIIHLNMQQFAYAFAMGIVFAYLVYFTKNIWAGIIPHFIVNATQGILGRWAFSVASTEVAYYAAETGQYSAIIIMGVFTLFTAPVVFILFRSLWRDYKERFEPQVPTENPYYQDPQFDVNKPQVEMICKDPPFFDRYVVGIVVIFVLFMLMIHFMT